MQFKSEIVALVRQNDSRLAKEVLAEILYYFGYAVTRS